ncbi:twisted gastrulation protein homolog 1-A-like [Pocillopora verrucosa]|uniref:twisted gastrulation protein homolog 1-A-like n=1 Tax=Pocillopora verrucosa TaxID=203993 RepID=UPI002796FCFA|nr:twisted gastrulation protein homolog 1-A-like [Pocillopora verrucosa]XP_058956415.1 twisted gastrulation protein homolog 1-A-like [Pocillopora verrucosa]
MKDLVSTLILLFTLMSLITFTSGTQPQNGGQFTQREIDAYKRCKSTACVARVSLCIINKDCANCRPIAGKNCTCCEDCFRCLGQKLWKKCCDCVGLCTHTPRNDTNSTQQISSSYGDLSRSIPTMFDIISQGSHFPIAFMTRGKKGSSNHCKVAFFHRCVAKEDCIVSCGDMGSHRYRWFRNGCCQCVGHRCKDYGELQPLCQMCGIN